jgi:hypothetical protein
MVSTRAQRAQPGMLEAGEHQLVESIAQHHPEDGEPRKRLMARDRRPPAGRRRQQVRTSAALACGRRRTGAALGPRGHLPMCGPARRRSGGPDLPPHPSDVVDQPVDLGGQLHIAFDANGGLVAAQGRLASTSGRLSVTSSSRSGWPFGRQSNRPAGVTSSAILKAPLHPRHAPFWRTGAPWPLSPASAHG